jgi:hypothetical protein
MNGLHLSGTPSARVTGDIVVDAEWSLALQYDPDSRVFRLFDGESGADVWKGNLEELPAAVQVALQDAATAAMTGGEP